MSKTIGYVVYNNNGPLTFCDDATNGHKFLHGRAATFYTTLDRAKRAIAKSEESDSSHDEYWKKLRVKRVVLP